MAGDSLGSSDHGTVELGIYLDTSPLLPEKMRPRGGKRLSENIIKTQPMLRDSLKPEVEWK